MILDIAKIKKDIFVAVISNGSMHQKENWKETAQAAYEWVIKDDTAKAPSQITRRRKK